MARCERRLKKTKSYFLSFASDIRSQGGEDGIIREIFRLIGTGSRYCVDIGAWDGSWLSNTYALLHENAVDNNSNDRWGGLLVEANEERAADCMELYKDNPGVNVVCAMAGLDGDSSLSSILATHKCPHDFDFLSIDIDGADYHLWDTLKLTPYRPRVVCIEFNPSIPNTVFFIQERNILVQQGSSLLAITELAQSMNYTIVATTTFNAIYIANEYCHMLPEIDTDLDSLHGGSTMTTEVFQTYDGELKFTGCLKLLWHKIALNADKLQVLKRKDRCFPFAPPFSLSVELLHSTLFHMVNTASAEYMDALALHTDADTVMAELETIAPVISFRGFFHDAVSIVVGVIETVLSSSFEGSTADMAKLFVLPATASLSALLESLSLREVNTGRDCAEILDALLCLLLVVRSQLGSIATSLTEDYLRISLLKIRSLRAITAPLTVKLWIHTAHDFISADAEISVHTKTLYEQLLVKESRKVNERIGDKLATFNAPLPDKLVVSTDDSHSSKDGICYLQKPAVPHRSSKKTIHFSFLMLGVAIAIIIGAGSRVFF